MIAALAQRRLLLRAGRAALTVDLTQVREVGGVPGDAALPLVQVLRLPGGAVPAALLWMETGREPVAVGVDAVGGVVEAAPGDVRPLPATARLERPGLVRAVLRLREPAAWRRTSLLPTPAAELGPLAAGGPVILAADLDPVELGRVLLEAAHADDGRQP